MSPSGVECVSRSRGCGEWNWLCEAGLVRTPVVSLVCLGIHACSRSGVGLFFAR